MTLFLKKNLLHCLLVLGTSALAVCYTLVPAHAQSDQETFWSQSDRTMAERFAAAKRSKPELVLFLQNMPKGADLHNHPLGATYSEYLLQTARKDGLNYNREKQVFTKALSLIHI